MIPIDKCAHLTPVKTITVAIILLGGSGGLDQGINYWNEENSELMTVEVMVAAGK